MFAFVVQVVCYVGGFAFVVMCIKCVYVCGFVCLLDAFVMYVLLYVLGYVVFLRTLCVMLVVCAL